MNTTRISTLLCAALFAGATALAGAQIAVHAGGGIGSGTSASIGMPGASISTNGSMGIGAGINGPLGNANVNANQDFGANASLNRNNAAANAALNAAIRDGATVQAIGNGTLTLNVAGQNGRTLTLNVPASVVASLGLQVGTQVAVSRSSAGIVLTNMTFVRSILGRAVVRSVNLAKNTISFTNRTGKHTLALARAVISRLRLHAGSQIMIALQSSNQLQVTTLAQSGSR